MKSTLLLPLTAVISITTVSSYAGDTNTMPDWLKRTDIEFDVQESLNPSISVETIQPLFMNENDTVFFQGRLNHDAEIQDQTLNLGLGYRYLTNDKTWLLGVNAWYDRTFDLDHERRGLGVEAIGEYITVRSNYYDAFSGWKTASTVNGVSTQEKALDGWDFELEAPVPYVPWARISAKRFEWDAINTKNVDGYSVGVRMNPTGNTELTIGATDDSTKDAQAFLNFAWYFDRPEGVEFTAADGTSTGVFVKRDVSKHRLDKVRRQNNIVVERKTTGGGGIVIGRRN